MKEPRAAKRYAGALLGLASELKKIDHVASDMRLVHDSIAASYELKLFFQSPIIDRFKKREIVKALFEEKVDELTFHFILLLVDKAREGLVDAIAVEFGVLLDEQLGIVKAELTAPYQFDEKSKARVQSKLEELTNKKVHINFSLDKNLVGGFLAQIGDTVYDGSVRRQLEILKQQLLTVKNYR
ncbi:MAG: ATP synthase F1 subunit delta [Candidatus Kryptoniota bacterium]